MKIPCYNEQNPILDTLYHIFYSICLSKVNVKRNLRFIKKLLN